MGRGKLNMELIPNVKSRNLTYKKRKSGLIKKAEEFNTLCDVETCVIIFRTKNGMPETFPEDSDTVRNIIKKFFEVKASKVHRGKTKDLSDFFVSCKNKVEADICKLRKANMEARFPSWDDRFNVFSVEQLRVLYETFDTKLQLAKRKLKMMKSDQYLLEDSKSGTLCSEFYNKQPLSTSAKPHDTQMRECCSSSQAAQMLPYDLNPVANPMTMLMMNCADDYTQYNGGMSRSNIPYTKIIPAYYNPMAAMPENVMYNPWSLPTCYYGPNMQPVAPYGQQVMPNGSSSHANAPQFNDFYHNINVKGFKRED